MAPIGEIGWLRYVKSDSPPSLNFSALRHTFDGKLGRRSYGPRLRIFFYMGILACSHGNRIDGGIEPCRFVLFGPSGCLKIEKNLIPNRPNLNKIISG